jgi:hypothetical protein
MLSYDDFRYKYLSKKFPVIVDLLTQFNVEKCFNPEEVGGRVREAYEKLLKISPDVELLLKTINDSVKMQPEQRIVMNAALSIVKNRDNIQQIKDYCYGETKPDNVTKLPSFVAFSILYLIGSQSVVETKNDTPPPRYSVLSSEYKNSVDQLRDSYLFESIHYFSQVIDILEEVRLTKIQQFSTGLRPTLFELKPIALYVDVINDILTALDLIPYNDYFGPVNIYRLYRDLKPVKFDDLITADILSRIKEEKG